MLGPIDHAIRSMGPTLRTNYQPVSGSYVMVTVQVIVMESVAARVTLTSLIAPMLATAGGVSITPVFTSWSSRMVMAAVAVNVWTTSYDVVVRLLIAG